MKNTLLIALSFLLMAGVFAKDIASYRFAISETVDGKILIKHMVATIADDMSLTIDLTKSAGTRPWFMEEVGPTTTHTKYLNESTYNIVKTQIVSISNAPIKRVHTPMVCMMMPGPEQSNDHLTVARGYDFNSASFLGDLELILGPQGCWVAHKVYPENERATQQARALKNSIKLLATELIGNL